MRATAFCTAVLFSAVLASSGLPARQMPELRSINTPYSKSANSKELSSLSAD
jgi:hypothetical protein